jgi:transposase
LVAGAGLPAPKRAFAARISRELLRRQENQPGPIRDIAWKGQVRLCARYRKLARAGKPANVVTTAIAREFAVPSGPLLGR